MSNGTHRRLPEPRRPRNHGLSRTAQALMIVCGLLGVAAIITAFLVVPRERPAGTRVPFTVMVVSPQPVATRTVRVTPSRHVVLGAGQR